VVSWVAKPGGRCQRGNSGSDPLWPAGPCPRQCAIQPRVRLRVTGVSVSPARCQRVHLERSWSSPNQHLTQAAGCLLCG